MVFNLVFYFTYLFSPKPLTFLDEEDAKVKDNKRIAIHSMNITGCFLDCQEQV